MPQFGSNPSVASQNQSATQDANGNPIISQANNFGASPLGVAARTQALYGIPNANFDLTCADPGTAVAVDNAIPYWSLETAGTISTTMVYDATTQNWSVRMDPTGADTGDYAILKTRTYLLNDDALALRQKAFASLTRQGTTGTAQWSIVLSATYYDEAGTQLSTFDVGTAADTGTWTGISGVTTSGSAAISTSAAYADIALTLTAAGSVSGTAKVDINSVLIATSQAAGGGSFLLTQTFLSSGTWTRPTGVEYVDVVFVGGGAGGQSGTVTVARSHVNTSFGGRGGGAGGYGLARNIYVGDQATISVGVGAGGAGGSASVSKGSGTAGGTAVAANGANGGVSTFGAYANASGGNAASGLMGGATSIAWLPQTVSTNGFFKSNGYSVLPYQSSYPVAGGAGAAGSAGGGAAGSVVTSAGGTSEGGFACGIAGQAADAIVQINPTVNTTGGTANSGAGGGGGAVAVRLLNVSGTYTATGGQGGAATANSGSGGGGGGGVAIGGTVISAGNMTSSTITGTSVAGSGAAGYVTVAWFG